jgi:GT2 family glycosyltransferase
VPASGSVTAVIVSYAEPAATRAAAASLLAQSRPPDEILVVENHPDGAAVRALGGLPVRILRPGRNLGFAQAVNLAASQARGEWLLLFNPDATAAPDCVERLLASGAPSDVAVVGSQVLLPDGQRVNAGDNPVHITGLSWAGRYLEPREEGPDRDTLVVSGAALMVRRDVFQALRGFPPGFFLYHEEVDLGWRANAAGWRVRYCPAATVRHDYSFAKGGEKWFWLERNRLWTVLTGYEARTLLVLAPLLLVTEVAIIVVALRNGWLVQKLRSYLALARWGPALLRWRRFVQGSRRVSDRALLGRFVGEIHTPVLDGPLLTMVNPWLARYRRMALWLLRADRA